MDKFLLNRGLNYSVFLVLIVFYPGYSLATPCSVNNGLISSNCTDFTWSSGNVFNSSTITSSTSDAVRANGSVGRFENSPGGQIDGVGSVGFIVPSGNDNVGQIINLGRITSQQSQGISVSGSVTRIENSGTIDSTAGPQLGRAAIFNWNNGSIGLIQNNGQINSPYGGIENFLGGTITEIRNGTNGVISSNFLSINNHLNSSIGTIVNSAIIGTPGGYIGILNADNASDNSTIGVITNTGTIIGTFGISNQRTITTINNAQGAGNASGALTYTGVLPTNYNVMIFSSSTYGRLAVTNGTGVTNFGVAAGSIVTNNTRYTSVLSGLSSSNIAPATTSGTYGPYSWTLTLQSGSTSVWDLIFGTVASSSGSSSSNYQSSLIATNRMKGINAARILEGLSANPGAMASVITALDGLSGVAQANAVTQTLPVITGASSQATTNSMQALNQVVQGRQNALRGMASGEEYIGNRDMWMKAFGSWANQADLNGVAGYKINTGGLAIGIDKGISPKINLGGVFAFANSGVSSNSGTAPSGVTINSYQVGVYGDYAMQKNLIANAQLDVGMNQNNAYRNILFMGTNANANYNSYSGHVGAGLRYMMPLDSKNTFIPSIRADYTTVQTNGYTETGAGALNLNVSSQTYNTLPVSADVRIDHALPNKLTLSANAGAGYNILNNQVSITSAYQGGGAAYATNGLQVSPWIYNAGAGITGQLTKGLQINVRYDNVFSTTGYMNQMVSARLKMPI